MSGSTDYNQVLYEKLYSKLAIALGVGSSEAGETIGESLLSIYNPGQYLPVGLNPVEKPEDDEEISLIFDSAPSFNFTYAPVLSTVSNVYQSILQFKRYPVADLTEGEKKKLQAALDKYASIVDACDAAETNYWTARVPFDEATASKKNGTGPGPTPSQEAAVKSAMNKWIAAGKVELDKSIDTMQQLQGRDGAVFWSDLDRRWQANQRELTTGRLFPPVTLAPSYANWFKETGWTKFSFKQKDMDNQSTSTSIGVAGELSGSFGIITISGSGNYEEDQSYTKVKETDLTFECELMRVSVGRSWMNPLLFNSRAWRFADDAPIGKLSTGGSIKDRIKPTGPFVAIPTTAILARNVKIIGKFQDTEEQEMRRLIEGTASFGIGPFSITGRVRYNQEERRVKGTIADNEISIKDTQIIAAISQVLPELPNPDPNLPWS